MRILARESLGESSLPGVLDFADFDDCRLFFVYEAKDLFGIAVMARPEIDCHQFECTGWAVAPDPERTVLGLCRELRKKIAGKIASYKQEAQNAQKGRDPQSKDDEKGQDDHEPAKPEWHKIAQDIESTVFFAKPGAQREHHHAQRSKYQKYLVGQKDDTEQIIPIWRDAPLSYL